MFNLIPKTKGFGYLIDMPWQIIWMLLFLGLLSLTFSSSLALTYLTLYGAYIAIWFISKSLLKSRSVEFNTNSGNTFQSILVALVVFMVIMFFNYLIVGLWGGGFNSVDTAKVIQETSKASLGAQSAPILERNPIAMFTVFGITPIPIVETLLYLGIILLGLYIFKVNINHPDRFHLLKITNRDGIIFLLLNTITAFGALIFHLQAKGVSDLPLLMVFIFFFITGVVGFTRLVGKRLEWESAIWLHIFNNSLSMMAVLNWLSAVGLV